MDPEANYKEQQRIRERIRTRTTIPGDYGRLSDLREALNNWVRHGGYDPRPVRRARRHPHTSR